MSVYCVPLVDSIVRGRPFIYLPDNLKDALKSRLKNALNICVASSFAQVKCISCPGQLCWIAGNQAYYTDGVAAVDFQIQAGGFTVKIAFAVSSIGVLGPGGRETFSGNCPFEDCSDHAVSGRLACEITGNLSISSNLLEEWNFQAMASTLAWLLTTGSRMTPLGTIFSVLDIRLPEDVGDAPFFEVSLKGGGPNNGAFYDLGPFTLTPP